MKTSFETRVSRMGLGSFVYINIFVLVCLYSLFLSKSAQILRLQKGSFVQRYSFKFLALGKISHLLTFNRSQYLSLH